MSTCTQTQHLDHARPIPALWGIIWAQGWTPRCPYLQFSLPVHQYYRATTIRLTLQNAKTCTAKPQRPPRPASTNHHSAEPSETKTAPGHAGLRHSVAARRTWITLLHDTMMFKKHTQIQSFPGKNLCPSDADLLQQCALACQGRELRIMDRMYNVNVQIEFQAREVPELSKQCCTLVKLHKTVCPLPACTWRSKCVA